LWSVAFLLPPALAAFAASNTPGPEPVTVTAAAERTAAEPDEQDRSLLGDIQIVIKPRRGEQAQPVVAATPTESALRQARRVLIDPGQDPLSAVANDLLWFDGDAAAAEPTDTVETEAKATSPASTGASAVDLTPELVQLREKLQKALSIYYPRHQNSRANNPWEVMHAIIAYGVHTKIFKDGPRGEPVNAVGWMAYNYPCAGQRMLFLNRGKIEAGRGVGVQGHGGQFLAILAQSRLVADYPLRVEGKDFTLADLIEREKETCEAGTELTFKLIALMHYLDSDETWTTPDGQEWSIPRLIKEELKAPIRGAACGGTHRLMGFSYAVNKRVQRGKPIVGEFRRAQIFTQDYHRYTFSLQNEDGSFSTAWFERRANDPSIDRRLKTSGHILEWIAFSLSDDELRDPRMIKATDYLATLLVKNDGHTWEIGPLGHGLHALALYNERVFKEPMPVESAPLADQTTTALEARHGADRAE
jgi:hypothetical protein